MLADRSSMFGRWTGGRTGRGTTRGGSRGGDERETPSRDAPSGLRRWAATGADALPFASLAGRAAFPTAGAFLGASEEARPVAAAERDAVARPSDFRWGFAAG